MEKNTTEETEIKENQGKEICSAGDQPEKFRFECDYLEGAVPEIMQRLMETNLVQTPGYSEDVYCESAREKIRALCGSTFSGRRDADKSDGDLCGTSSASGRSGSFNRPY